MVTHETDATTVTCMTLVWQGPVAAFRASYAGSIPVARCQLLSAALASCDSTSSPAADRSLRKRFISWKPNAA